MVTRMGVSTLAGPAAGGLEIEIAISRLVGESSGGCSNNGFR